MIYSIWVQYVCFHERRGVVMFYVLSIVTGEMNFKIVDKKEKKRTYFMANAVFWIVFFQISSNRLKQYKKRILEDVQTSKTLASPVH